MPELHQHHPRLPILVASFGDEEAYAPLALEVGARAYLAKGVGDGRLVAGIRKVLKGGVAINPTTAAQLRRKGMLTRPVSVTGHSTKRP